jgi:hypothetical protein
VGALESAIAMTPSVQAARRLKVCVIGTSNAVMRDGYVEALRTSPHIECLQNFSLGGACSQAFAFHRRRIDFSQFDLCILDFCVNDTTLVTSGLQSIDRIEPVLAEAIAIIRQNGCVPTLFILPLLYRGESPVPDLYVEIAHKHRVPFFDGYRVISELLTTCTGLEQKSLFEDPFHIHRWIARELISWLIDAFMRVGKIQAGGPYLYGVARHEFVDIVGCFGAGFDIRERQTSLLCGRLRDLNPSTVLDIALPDHARVVGVAFDMSNSRGILSLTGSIAFRIDLTTLEFVGDRTSLVLTVWPLPVAIAPVNGTIRINVLDNAPCDISLRHEIPQDRWQLLANVGFAGFIVLNGSSVFRLDNVEFDRLDLLAAPEGAHYMSRIRKRLAGD